MSEKLDLDALERRCAAATPGPWTLNRAAACYSGEVVKTDKGYEPKHTYYVTRIRELGFVATAFHGGEPGDTSADYVPPDAALIVALRNAAPALLSELRALRRVAEAAKEMRLAESDWMALCSVSIPSRGDLATLRCESARKELDAALKEAGL